MASRLPIFVVLILHLLVLQEMMVTMSEAVLCESSSRLFRGACFRSSNCATICEKEGFLNGRCKFFKCICSKDCNGGGGGGGDGGSGGGDGGGSGGDGGSDGGEGGGEDPPEGPPADGGDAPPENMHL